MSVEETVNLMMAERTKYCQGCRREVPKYYTPTMHCVMCVRQGVDRNRREHAKHVSIARASRSRD